jgi:hypothetical protein
LALGLDDFVWLASVVALSIGTTFLLLYLLGFRPGSRPKATTD